MADKFYTSNLTRYQFIAPNIYFETYGEIEADLLCIRKSGYVDEVEIKRTYADFKADFKKTARQPLIGPLPSWTTWRTEVRVPKHEALAKGQLISNRFSFLVPESLVEKLKPELPGYAGLYAYYHKNAWVREIKQAPLLHKRKITDAQYIHLGRKMAYRYWSLRRAG